jgi:hypothetical protein
VVIGDTVREKESIIRSSIKYAVLVSVLGYAFVVASGLAIWAIFGLTTGWFPSFTFFALALITFRLTEINGAFFVVPPLLAIVAMMLLSSTPINRRMAAGVSLSSYYVLVALMYVIVGAGEFALEAALPWIVWAFVLGLGASVIVDKVSDGYWRGQR